MTFTQVRRTEQGRTSAIPVNASLKQGHVLSPVLFNIGVEILLRYSGRYESYGYKYEDSKLNVWRMKTT
ncbi:hypothetical protein L596_006023 [Steinernema carpocapsae]|uniref:Reverse transcriptase domain-containing protein n=1 Tax=Steinernema carpocapsae TaxID=34508 RepID=A0A4V6I8U2_STECR|nr:hypothetical protein L596_006023 [Steinernema carpocapsae]